MFDEDRLQRISIGGYICTRSRHPLNTFVRVLCANSGFRIIIARGDIRAERRPQQSNQLMERARHRPIRYRLYEGVAGEVGGRANNRRTIPFRIQ